MVIDYIVLGTVRPNFHALTVLQIVLPLALVLRPGRVNVGSEPIGHIVVPIAIVDVTIDMN
jgi:hypothetical protein